LPTPVEEGGINDPFLLLFNSAFPLEGARKVSHAKINTREFTQRGWRIIIAGYRSRVTKTEKPMISVMNL
jgi:hypothetical protein